MLAMRRDGSVLTWGFGEQGQLGRLGSRMRNPEETMLHPALVPLHNAQGECTVDIFKLTALGRAHASLKVAEVYSAK